MARTFTFGQKLGAGMALIVILALSIALVAFNSLRAVVDGKDRVIQITGQNLIDAERLRAEAQRKVGSARGFLLTQDQRFVEETQAANLELGELLRRIRGRDLSPQAAELVAAIESAAESYQQEVTRMIDLRLGGAELPSASSAFDEGLIPRYEELAESVRAFVAEMERERDEGREAATAAASRAESFLALVALGTVILSAVVAIFLSRGLGRQIGSSVQHIRSSSAELEAAATQQASGAKEQATAMSEITTTISELLATSRQIAESGQHVAKMAADSARSAQSGRRAVDSARAAVASIDQQVEAIVEHMLGLGKKSQQIGGILELINELAEQTNILAINATIEASGAGESGRRFAAVGNEIRKLADRVGGSTKEIRTLIEEIRAAVNTTVMATESGSKAVDAGAERFKELETAFAQIDELVISTKEAGREIELSTKQQATAVEQVNVAISDVAQATNETEASSSQTLQTASELAALSDQLLRLIEARKT